jgi:serine/threonine protein phosphatase PrpC
VIPVERAHLDVVAGSHPGMAGKNNEDQFSISAFRRSATDTTPSLFAMIADGIGGHRGGEIAAGIAVEMISEAVARSDASQPTAIMQAAILQASQTIFVESKSGDEKQGMGTTCVCVWIIENQLYATSVGNSRLYLLRGSKMHQLTVDHTWVQEAVEAGALTDEQARMHPHANIIRRYLGSAQPVEVDLRLRTVGNPQPTEKNQGMKLYPGDRLILCSDGLSDMVDDEIIRKIARTNELDDVVPALIEEANLKGGKDNITVVALEVPRSGLGIRLPRIDFGDRKVQLAISYAGLALIGLILLIALGMFAWRTLIDKAPPTPPPISTSAPVVVVETATP